MSYVVNRISSHNCINNNKYNDLIIHFNKVKQDINEILPHYNKRTPKLKQNGEYSVNVDRATPNVIMNIIEEVLKIKLPKKELKQKNENRNR